VADDIIVSGGGSVAVASDAILARIEGISRLAGQFRLDAGELIGLSTAGRLAAIPAARLPPSARAADRGIDDALALIDSTAARAEMLYRALRGCLDLYGETEQRLERLGQSISAHAAWLLGYLTPFVVIPIATDLVIAEGIAAVVTGLSPKQQARAVGALLRGHDRIITNPLTVGLLRAAVMDADDFESGLLHVPYGLARAAGDQGAGILGLTSAAASVIHLANVAGLLEETDVTVRRTTTKTDVAAPDSLADRAARIPDPSAEADGEQIRIDRYSAPGRPDRFDVYIAGTVDFGVTADDEPFDMTSNLVGIEQGSPGSYRAVLDAMREAGVTPSSPVVLNGYSQGGLVAALVAASGDYDVKGVVTFGAPSGQVRLPADIPVLTVRHSEDIVPATGGDDVNRQAVVVERAPFAGAPIPDEWAVPAHQMVYYRQTAALVDRAQSDEVRGTLDALDGFGSGADSIESSLWAARRVTAGTTSPGP
jgi:hypothetical protein